MRNKKKFIISIEETVVDEVEIISDTAKNAIKIAEEEYKKGNIVISPGEVQHRQMAVIQPNEEATDWYEF